MLTPIGVMEPQGTPPLAQGRETEADTPARSRNVLEKMLAVWSGEFPVPHPPCFRSSCWIQVGRCTAKDVIKTHPTMAEGRTQTWEHGCWRADPNLSVLQHKQNKEKGRGSSSDWRLGGASAQSDQLHTAEELLAQNGGDGKHQLFGRTDRRDKL